MAVDVVCLILSSAQMRYEYANDPVVWRGPSILGYVEY